VLQCDSAVQAGHSWQYLYPSALLQQKPACEGQSESVAEQEVPEQVTFEPTAHCAVQCETVGHAGEQYLYPSVLLQQKPGVEGQSVSDAEQEVPPQMTSDPCAQCPIHRERVPTFGSPLNNWAEGEQRAAAESSAWEADVVSVASGDSARTW
jgi:hypothetical protein